MESADVADIKRHFNVVAEGLEKKIQLDRSEGQSSVRQTSRSVIGWKIA